MDQVSLLLALAGVSSDAASAGVIYMDCSDLTYDESLGGFAGDENFDGQPVYDALQAGQAVWLDISGEEHPQAREMVVCWFVTDDDEPRLVMNTLNYVVVLTNFSQETLDPGDIGEWPDIPPLNPGGSLVLQLGDATTERKNKKCT